LDKEAYQRAYSDVIEQLQRIFNRLFAKKRLCESCRDCPLMVEMDKLKELVKDDQFDQMEKELGYYLH
jgi:hypothetical protein